MGHSWRLPVEGSIPIWSQLFQQEKITLSQIAAWPVISPVNHPSIIFCLVKLSIFRVENSQCKCPFFSGHPGILHCFAAVVSKQILRYSQVAHQFKVVELSVLRVKELSYNKVPHNTNQALGLQVCMCPRLPARVDVTVNLKTLQCVSGPPSAASPTSVSNSGRPKVAKNSSLRHSNRLLKIVESLG